MFERVPVNPFDAGSDPDRHAIWEILIVVDSVAFVAGDWKAMEGHFDAEDFEGIRCGDSGDPDRWGISFADVGAYRDSWVEASGVFRSLQFRDYSNLGALLARCRIDRIDLMGDRGLAHKKFSGELVLADGTRYAPGARQTLYRMRKRGGEWKITGFLGRLPLAEEA